MSKAYLIVDMPICCDECAFLNDDYDYPECSITNESRGYNFNIRENKMDNCPLRDLIEDENKKDMLIAALKARLQYTDKMLSRAYQIIGEVIDHG